MNDHKAFMDAIVADPQDDVVRLVYADWLEENGDPIRAEFIRIQCQLAKEFAPQAREKLRLRENQILEKSPGLLSFSLPNKYSAVATIDRGFISEIDCNLKAWHDGGPEFLVEMPTIQKVTVTDKIPFGYFQQKNQYCCYWSMFDPDETDQSEALYYQIPSWIFEHLTQTLFESVPDAMQELSDACIRWAKAQIEMTNHE